MDERGDVTCGMKELAAKGDDPGMEEGHQGAEREHWGKKIDFLLSVIGFAVDLGNVWRFPYICYRNGGGAFFIPYFTMYFLGGLPLFYLELALGQYQRCGCISVWDRVCPLFKGIGYGIAIIASFMSFYYNTIIAWAIYYFFASFRREVPWSHCRNDWNTANCTEANFTRESTSAAAEFFQRKVLMLHRADGIERLGSIKWDIALCLLLVFIIVYFALWKGIKTSGKVVWFTALAPYVILLVLLVRGITLDGALDGIIYYLKPQWHRLKSTQVWTDAATQVFFSLGPGFGTLMAYASYNRFHNNCYRDALITSGVNCFTSILAGFVIFSVLGHMSSVQNLPISEVAQEGPGLVFEVYPQAIAAMPFAPLWAIIFFLMLITLGLDSTFGGLEALITGFCDEFPALRRRRELFVAALMLWCYLGALPTTTYGGSYVIQMYDAFGTQLSILFIVFLEAVAVCWFYGVSRFSDDIKHMLGFSPGIYWRACWTIISPVFTFAVFLIATLSFERLEAPGYAFPDWAMLLGWVMTSSSLACIPAVMLYKVAGTPGSLMERLEVLTRPMPFIQAQQPDNNAIMAVTSKA